MAINTSTNPFATVLGNMQQARDNRLAARDTRIDNRQQAATNRQDAVAGYKDCYSECLASGLLPAQCMAKCYGESTADPQNQYSPGGVNTAEQEQCVKNGGTWVYNPTTMSYRCSPGIPQTIPTVNEQPPSNIAWERLSQHECAGVGGVWDGNRCNQPTQTPSVQDIPGPNYIERGSLDVQQDPSQIPYMNMGAYGGILAELAGQAPFGGQTLEELENARLAATEADYNRMYGKSADDLTQRINRESNAAGMYHSGLRVDPTQGTGLIPKYLSELESEKNTKLGVAQAEIRGERPELLLAARKQTAEIANMWGQMDQNMQSTNLDQFLNGRLMEYDREFKNGNLDISAFNGNVNMLGMYLTYAVNSAQTDGELALIRANIDKIYKEMNDTDRNLFLEFIMGNQSALNRGGFGG